MRVGKLDRRVTVEKKAVTKDTTYNTEVVTWVALVMTTDDPPVARRDWASVTDVLPGKTETIVQGIAVTKVQTRIQMRWRDDMDSSMRITVHGDADQIYQIVGGPVEIGRKEFIALLCERFSS